MHEEENKMGTNEPVKQTSEGIRDQSGSQRHGGGPPGERNVLVQQGGRNRQQ
jgi:hypothetical protein